ncbi:MAG: hypothetical protein VYA69_09785 [Gemmatimonadota bacterium]|nr:hypothetical protein [Gemmatimonadota bacterium]
MQNLMEKVQTFHEVCGGHAGKMPTVDLSPETMALRVELLREEVEEYAQAITAGDLVGVADALTDILYVLLGAYVTHGLQTPAQELFDEVHRSNMSKLDEQGKPVYREDGKVIKSDMFSPPDLDSILRRHMDA